jgi:hypothetical protein
MARSTIAAAVVFATLGLASQAHAIPRSSSDGFDRSVRIYNNTSSTMYNVFASRASNRWYDDDDLLGSSVLRPGESMVVEVDDGTGACVFDLKAVFDNNRVRTTRMNVCRRGSWTVG